MPLEVSARRRVLPPSTVLVKEGSLLTFTVQASLLTNLALVKRFLLVIHFVSHKSQMMARLHLKDNLQIHHLDKVKC